MNSLQLAPTDAAIHLHPLRQILSQRSVSTHFQPIVSVKRKAVIGVEALARATDPGTGRGVPPVDLFRWAREQDRLLELDRCCQAQAMQAFNLLPSRDPELLLFLNVEASLLDANPELSLLHAAQRAGVRPGNVVLEINETQVNDSAPLQAFVRRHRADGFLIAMDDLGSGHSSLQRWPLLKPDVIKLDRSLVDGVAGSFFAQELLRSLIALGRQTGALILAEGVETEADVNACLDLGVDLFQGYYFAKPAADPNGPMDRAVELTQLCAVRHKRRGLERLARRRGTMEQHSRQARALGGALSQVLPQDFAQVLRSLPWPDAVESVMVLDQDGQQFSPVLFLGSGPTRDRASLFQAPKPGNDHSDREYYYALMEGGLGRDCFLTDAHLSPASGHLCRTLSHRFDHPQGGRFVVCLEIGAA